MKLDIMEIAKRSWEITWKHKYLWVLGFLISLASGGSSLSNSSNWSNNSSSTSGSASSFSNFAEAYLVIVIIFILVMGFLMTVFTILSIIAQGGLIGAAGKIERGETTSLKDAFSTGAHYFWKLFGLSIVVGLVIIAMVLVIVAVIGVIALVFFSGGNQNMVGPGLACLIPLAILLICLLVFVIIVLGVVSNYGTRLIVLENAGVFDALRRGYALFKARWLDTVVMYLVIAVITGIGGAILGIPGLIVAVPSAFALIGGAAAENVGLIFLGVAGFLLAGLVGAVFNSIVAAYGSVAWTLTFLRLTAPEVPAEK